MPQYMWVLHNEGQGEEQALRMFQTNLYGNEAQVLRTL